MALILSVRKPRFIPLKIRYQLHINNVFGDGFSQEIDVVTLAIQMGVLKKMNEWYSFNGQKLGRGIFSVKE